MVTAFAEIRRGLAAVGGWVIGSDHERSMVPGILLSSSVLRPDSRICIHVLLNKTNLMLGLSHTVRAGSRRGGGGMSARGRDGGAAAPRRAGGAR
jgi:hypothetical protein